jgi:CRP-like cAMP-binding protein
MSDNLNQTLNLKKDQVLITAGSTDTDLYFIVSGKVMVFVQNGSQITPVAYLGEREFIGELSFFDNTSRSASIITTENSEIIKISAKELYKFIPKWLHQMGLQLSRKIRSNDELIRSRGLRKTKVESIKPLSIEEQTRIYKILEEFKKSSVK